MKRFSITLQEKVRSLDMVIMFCVVAMSGLSIAVCGIMTVVLASVFANIPV